MFPSTDNSPVFLLTVPKSPACYVAEEWVTRSDDVIAMTTNIDPPSWVPIRPLCSRLLDQVDVLALCILLCAEDGHCGSWVLRGKPVKVCGLYVEQSTNQYPALLTASNSE